MVMAFTRFPSHSATHHTPTTPVTQTARLPPQTPTHRHLRSIRPSSTDSSSNSLELHPGLSEYRSRLSSLLDTERWDHCHTRNALQQEIRKREKLEKEIFSLQKECRDLQSSWAISSNELIRCESARSALAVEVQRVQMQLAHCRARDPHLSAHASLHSGPKSLFMTLTTAF